MTLTLTKHSWWHAPFRPGTTFAVAVKSQIHGTGLELSSGTLRL